MSPDSQKKPPKSSGSGLGPSPTGVQKPSGWNSSHPQRKRQLRSPSFRIVDREMKTENSHSHQNSYDPLAPSQSAVPPSATTKTTAPQPVALHPTVSVPVTPPPWSQPLSAASPSKQKTKDLSPAVPTHPATATELIRADERLKMREELLDRGYNVPNDLFQEQQQRQRHQGKKTENEDENDEEEREPHNLTPGQKLRRAELSIDIEEEKGRLKSCQTAAEAAKAALVAAEKAFRKAKDHHRVCAKELRQARGRVDKLSKMYRAV
ncbi:uncharacterized protein BO72DRAFT_524872 [Aspergillus fijiensis CBS 313.89]|uniref:Uncharacterized protein n=1 Tax=Aspergillus fijiensis CBS 313.89 TaxID=1448319 RepID=A0A8G1RY79_9EURO|nr:uncharacterized protein BO72DRAFT_524872 [Aspergillus fijiensis CBS 313.89]RAK80922.1 hypothetical protein BO72DRAFT_524872 [Aspergillus fijiensis CBS 313.89]